MLHPKRKSSRLDDREFAESPQKLIGGQFGSYCRHLLIRPKLSGDLSSETGQGAGDKGQTFRICR